MTGNSKRFYPPLLVITRDPSTLGEPGIEASYDQSTHFTTKFIRQRYILGSCLIAVLGICSGAFVQIVITAQQHEADIVNLAGRQRMLSQRTALFAQLLVDSDQARWAINQTALKSTLDLMEQSHNSLIYGDPLLDVAPPNSKALQALYFAAPLATDTQVREFIARGRKLLGTNRAGFVSDNADLQAILTASSLPLLTALDAVTQQYALESRQHVESLRSAQVVIVALLLLLLILEAQLIFRPMELEVGRRNAELVQAYDQTIEGWSRALDLRDHETEGHSIRVTEMTYRLARLVGMNPADLAHVRRGALLHDIGKVGIPDAILLKPAQLSEAEWEVMRRHPAYAGDLLRPIAFLRPALEIPLHHHERWDGTGYPAGLSQTAIPFAARLFAVVDIWDALSSKRPYREAWPATRVREHISSLAGSHLDPAAVALFLKHEAAILAGLYND